MLVELAGVVVVIHYSFSSSVSQIHYNVLFFVFLHWTTSNKKSIVSSLCIQRKCELTFWTAGDFPALLPSPASSFFLHSVNGKSLLSFPVRFSNYSSEQRGRSNISHSQACQRERWRNLLWLQYEIMAFLYPETLFSQPLLVLEIRLLSAFSCEYIFPTVASSQSQPKEPPYWLLQCCYWY